MIYIKNQIVFSGSQGNPGIMKNIIELKKCKYWEQNTAGTIIKNINGLVIPPVKKSKIPNWIISKLKYIVEVKLLSWFSFILNCKCKFNKTLIIITEIQKK